MIASGSTSTPTEAGPPAGRTAELAALESALDGLERGRSRCVAIVGEPGIGKTRLAAEFVVRVRERGLPALAAAGDTSAPRREFGLVLDALGEYARRAPPGDPYLRRHALRAAVERLADTRPLLLVADQLEAADEHSVRLLCDLLRRPLDAALLLLLVYRPRQASRSLLRAVAAAAREGHLTRLELAPLDEAGARELLGDALDDRVLRALHRESGGNPLYLEQLARGRAAGRHLDRGQPPDLRDPIPSAVRAEVAEELATLPQTARAVGRAAAVAGDRFDPDLAARVADIGQADALDAIDALLRLDLVRPAGSPGRFAFRRPVVRRAVYQSSDAPDRRIAHRRAAAALADRGAPVALQAYHVERSADRGDERAIELLTAAANAALPHDVHKAGRWFAAGLRLLPDRAAHPSRAALLAPLAIALGARGRVVESRGALAQALALAPAQLPLERAPIAVAAMRLDHMRGRPSAARALTESTLRELSEDRSAATAALALELALDDLLAGRWDSLLDGAAVALAGAAAAAEPALRSEATALISLGSCYRGDVPWALDSAARAYAGTEQLTAAELAPRIETFVALAQAQVAVERLGAAVRVLDRGLEIARRTRQERWVALLATWLAIVHLLRGSPREAAQAADAIGPARGAAALAVRCWIAVLDGDVRAASAAGERAMEDGAGQVHWLAGHALAAVSVAAGTPARGRELLLEHAGGDRLPRVPPDWRPRCWAVLADAELALDRPDAAASWVARIQESTHGLSGRMGEARRAAAAVALATGDAPRAACEALQAAEHLEASDRRADAAAARVLAGRALALAGDRAQAIGALRRAHGELAAVGAAAHREAAAAELRRLGSRVRPADAPGGDAEPLAGFTEREREVSSLVARGLTNREIAAVLFLSEKTVERHLHRIFRRLGLSTRSELAALVARETEGARSPARSR